MNKLPLISLVIPAYKQEKTIVEDITRIKEAMESLSSQYNYELIVVVDGFLDKTYERAQKVKSRKIKVIGYKVNQGKGHAVRYGMREAKGDIIGFMDAGMDINTNGIGMLLSHFAWYNADVIIGSKLHQASIVKYPRIRRIISWGYRLVTRVLFGFYVRDTQVGLKFFRKAVVKKVLPKLLVKKYAFDIEFLAVAYQMGYKRIYEAPVEIEFNATSNITSRNFWKIIGRMLWDTLAVYYRLKILHYYSK